jgi:hypothetical protein
MDGYENLTRADVDSCRARLFYGSVAQAQAFVSCFEHSDLSFGSEAAKPRK